MNSNDPIVCVPAAGLRASSNSLAQLLGRVEVRASRTVEKPVPAVAEDAAPVAAAAVVSGSGLIMLHL